MRRTRVSTLAILLLICLLPASATPARDATGSATVTLSGVVRLESGEPVGNLRLSVAETGARLASLLTATRADGSFSLEVPAGTYSISTFVSTLGGAPNDLVDQTVYAIEATASRNVDVVVRRGRPIQTCIVAANGTPLPKARVTVFGALNEPVASALADDTGWVRIVGTAERSLLVVPPETRGRSIGRWLRYDELAIDERGIAAPIVLDALPEPVPTSSDTTLLYRGSAPGDHVTIVFVAEGFTDLEEPFSDTNGNGVCDDEPFLDTNGNGRFEDGELYVDANNDGRRTKEPFTDTNGDGVCNRDERELFLTLATDHMRMLLAFPVYRELRDRIDAYALFVPSRQAGSDFVNAPISFERDTAFDSRFQSRNFIFAVERDEAFAAAFGRIPQTSVVGLITYSPFGIGRESSGSTVVLFGARKTELGFVLAHEFGHTIGDLADEYFDYDGSPPYTGTEPFAANVTRTSALGDLKWAAFLRPGATIPTPDGTPGVGAFSGGLHRREGISRPSFMCTMRSLSTFCPVCSNDMFQNFAKIKIIPRPPSPALLMPRDGARYADYFSVGFDLDDFSRVVAAQAIVDGVAVGTRNETAPYGVTLDARSLSPGSHTVAMEVTFVDGSKIRTATVRSEAAPRARSAPDVASVRFRGGGLVLSGGDDLAVPGAALFVNGVDRFPLERTANGEVRTVKRASGSASGARLAKVLKRGQAATLVVFNPDGGRSDELTFTR